MNIQTALISMLSVFVIGAIGFAQQTTEETEKEPTFILATAETQLQKRLLNVEPGTSFEVWYLELNGNRFLESSNDSKEQWAILTKAINAIKNKESGIFTSVTFYGDIEDSEFRPIQSKMAEMIKDGFKGLGNRISANPDANGWEQRVEHLSEKGSSQQDPASEEIVVGNQDFTLYSVVHPFSKFLTNGSHCYIEIHEKAKQSEGFLSAKIRKSIAELFEKHSLTPATKISFAFGAMEATGDWPQKMKAEVKKFTKSQGIEKVGITFNPQLVDRTESLALIGNLVPDFSMTLLDSEEEVMFSELRAGKFTILNFWGFT